MNFEFLAGLDIVPLHADLLEVGSSQLANRITWVQANLCASQHLYVCIEFDNNVDIKNQLGWDAVSER